MAVDVKNSMGGYYYYRRAEFIYFGITYVGGGTNEKFREITLASSL